MNVLLLHKIYPCEGAILLLENFSLYPFPSFGESSWEAASPPVFSLDVVSQIIFNDFGTPQIGMASVDGLPKYGPSTTNTAEVFAPPIPVVVH